MKIIIDGSYIAFRTFHKSPPLTNSKGIPTGVVHGVMNVLLTLSNRFGKDNVSIVFDHKSKNRRHEQHPEYKATRDATPEDLNVQFQILDELIPLTGIAYYRIEGYEGDDIMATLAAHAEGEVGMLTRDKDIFQIVDDRVKIYDSQTNEFAGRELVLEKFKVLPEKMGDLLALTGDTSDNIPGVPKVGVVTAAKLLDEFGSLDGIYANLDKIKGKVKENLENNKEQAYLSRKLVELDILEKDPEPENREDRALLMEKLQEYELKSVIDKLNAQKPETDEEPQVQVIELKECSPANIELVLFEGGKMYAAGGGCFYEYAGQPLENVKYFYDIKHIYKLTGFRSENIYDLMLVSWLNDADTGGLERAKTEELPAFIARLLASAEAEVQALGDNKLEKIYFDMELPCAYVLADMETAGIALDKSVMEKVADRLRDEVGAVSDAIKNFVGHDINLNSPKQLQSFLFEELSLMPPKKTKTGNSTDEEAIKALISLNPIYASELENILKYRELTKLLTTYALPLCDYAGADGRIHTSFKQTGTATGRLSSVNPNMQNIPMKGDYGVLLRSAFVPAEGYKFVSFDYSQIELRILAHLTGDVNLREAYRNNEDIHTKTAAGIFHVAPDQVTSHMRRMAKAVNFGILYGLSAFGLSRDTGIAQKEAKTFIERYFAAYPSVRTFIDKTVQETRTKGYAETILGRRRYIKEINSRNKTIAMRGERIAVNVPMQGSAADIIKLAMVECGRVMDDNKYDARMVLQVHDELVFEVKADIAEEFAPVMQKIMESVVTLDVPLVVNGAVGNNLGELK
ncbi:DNA polymerase I [Seleniivibrio sp.]|uniref:DNA polymerase I n=1 Tax=Seleniivibrio sp. TaxID=2898801 RepID=UPI0025DC3FF8|nr:DNA polymerase I [Seleniivibrio sp.]MCD8553637.1 DNA polymerase I [Seleniivibrio sp.]